MSTFLLFPDGTLNEPKGRWKSVANKLLYLHNRVLFQRPETPLNQRLPGLQSLGLDQNTQPKFGLKTEQQVVIHRLRQEVFDGSEHAIPFASLDFGIVEASINPTGQGQLGLSGHDPFSRVRLAIFTRDQGRLIIHVSSAIRPADIVKENRSAICQ